ncbi:tail fiber protein [Salmonella enterica]
MTVVLTAISQKTTFQKESSSVVYSLINGKWKKPEPGDVGNFGTAAFRNVQTNPKDQSSGAVLINGSWGLGGNVTPLANSELLNRSGFPTSLFLQGGGSTDNHFNGYGFGIHGNYGVTGDGSRALSGNLFVDGDGNLSVEWLTINTADGTIISQKIQKLYGPLNPPPDGTTTQKGIVQLNSSTNSTSTSQAATPSAVKSAFDLATSKYTADGATTAKAGLVQLVNGTGGSSALVMPQAAVTTAIQTYPSLGKGQTLQDLKLSRGTGVTYTNSTGFPIAVYVRITGGTSANLYAYVDGLEFGGGGATALNTSLATAFFIVPNNSTYRVDASGVSTVLQAWAELR